MSPSSCARRLRQLQAYSDVLPACDATVDAATTCAASTACGALDLRGGAGLERLRWAPAPAAPAAPAPAPAACGGSSGPSGFRGVSRCLYRTEGGAPGVVCEAVEQWPDFRFGALEPWDESASLATRCLGRDLEENYTGCS
jgi:hypothetical protein